MLSLALCMSIVYRIVDIVDIHDTNNYCKILSYENIPQDNIAILYITWRIRVNYSD